MSCRKNFVELTVDERNRLADALNALNAQGAIHHHAQHHEEYFNNGIHRGPAFLPSHRHMMLLFEQAQQSTATYNEVVRAANSIINAKKTTTAAADVKAVEAALAKLGAAKRRHEPDVKALCQSYETLQNRKDGDRGRKGGCSLEIGRLYETGYWQVRAAH